MIRAEDAEFHAADPDDPTWAETNYFGFYNAEEHLNFGVYALFRRTSASSAHGLHEPQPVPLLPWEADYSDFAGHLPDAGAGRCPTTRSPTA